MTPQRIPAAQSLDERQRTLLAEMRTGPDGQPLNLFRVLVHYPLLLDRVAALGRVFLREGTLPVRERELVILRVAARVRSRYELAQHARMGHDLGVLGEADLDRIVQPGIDGWTPQEAAMLRLADELLDADAVGDATWAAAAAHLDERQLLELVFMVGYYRMLAGFLSSAGVPVEAAVAIPPQAAGW